jgi:hypothetical protein
MYPRKVENVLYTLNTEYRLKMRSFLCKIKINEKCVLLCIGCNVTGKLLGKFFENKTKLFCKGTNTNIQFFFFCRKTEQNRIVFVLLLQRSHQQKKSASINCKFQQLNTWQIAVCTVDVYCKGFFFLTGFANKIKLEKRRRLLVKEDFINSRSCS